MRGGGDRKDALVNCCDVKNSMKGERLSTSIMPFFTERVLRDAKGGLSRNMLGKIKKEGERMVAKTTRGRKGEQGDKERKKKGPDILISHTLSSS